LSIKNKEFTCILLLLIILTQSSNFQKVGADDPVEIATDWYDYIENIPNGSAILFSPWYEPSNMNELFPMTLAVMHQLFQKNVKVILVTFQAEGTNVISQALEVINPQNYGKTYSVDWVNLGYIAGQETALAALARDLTFPGIDYYGTLLEELPIMQSVKSASDISLVILISDKGVETFLRQWQVSYNVPMICGCTLALSTAIVPYLLAGNISASLYGLSSVAEYEKLVSMPTYFKVTSPNGGENWITGSNHEIMWAFTGTSGEFVKIELLKGNVVNLVISSSTDNDGSYSWTIPPTQTLGSDYAIKVTSTTNAAITDTSNNKFIITEPQVAVGDWAKYVMNATWHSSDPNATEPDQIKEQKEIKWMKIEIQNVSDTITMLQTYYYKNGTETTLAPISGDMKLEFLAFIIPSNLQKGDKIPGSMPFNPIDEAQGIYAGMKRNLTYANFTMSFFGMNMTMNMYWDRSTGILCEMNTTASMRVGSDSTTQSTSTKMTETNLWKIVTQLSCSVSQDTIKEGSSILVSGSIDADLPGRAVILTYRKPDGSILNRTVTTDSKGAYSDSYTLEANGSWGVSASWEGDITYTGAISLLNSIMVTPKPFFETSLGLATIGIAILSIVSVVFFLRVRVKRKN
jgi:hypothetical protein